MQFELANIQIIIDFCAPFNLGYIAKDTEINIKYNNDDGNYYN
jgi:hypothetical protein